MDQWHYSRDGDLFGPVSPDELKELLRSGTLTPLDRVQAAGSTDWLEVSKTPWLHDVWLEAEDEAKRKAADSWYYRTANGSDLGPIPFSELQELADTGQITAETPIRVGNKKWVRAKAIKKLTLQQPNQSRLVDCEDCGKSISKLATSCPICGAPRTEGPKNKHRPYVQFFVIGVLLLLGSMICYLQDSSEWNSAQKLHYGMEKLSKPGTLEGILADIRLNQRRPSYGLAYVLLLGAMFTLATGEAIRGTRE